MSLSLYEKWCAYTSELSAPQTFLDFGFYFIIGAALQRRVWIGSLHKPLFPNQYVILCGPPGVGKGLTLDEVIYFLTYHKQHGQEGIREEKDLLKTTRDPKIESMPPTTFRDHEAKSSRYENSFVKKPELPLLFPMAANATTWEALISCFAKTQQYIGLPTEDGKGTKPMVYSSLFAALNELSSMFRKKAEEVTKMLLELYDCKDYEYDNIGRGKDKLHHPSFSLIAGTTPAFMQSSFDDRLMSEGLNSRIWYIYEYANRHQKVFYEDLTTQQKIYRAEILEHVKLLSKLRGQATFSIDARKYLNDWWGSHPKTPRANPSPRLADYYSRKQVHVMKLAMAIHFSQVTSLNDMVIRMPSIKLAMLMLEKAEKNMHFALQFKTANPLALPSKKIETLLRGCGKEYMTLTELHDKTWEELKMPELEETLNSLVRRSVIDYVKEKETGNVKGYKIKV